jgi:hypothetical protein
LTIALPWATVSVMLVPALVTASSDPTPWITPSFQTRKYSYNSPTLIGPA